MGRTKKAGSKKIAPALKPKKTAAKPSKASKKAHAAAKAGPIVINRAPVLELWVAVVAERQGFTFDEGLTFGKLVAGWFAQSKGRALGIYERKEEPSEQERQARERRDRELGVERVDCFGLHCPALQVGNEMHAVADGKAISPGSVRGSLTRAFGDRLEDVKEAMETLAAAIPPERIGKVAYHLYERFRPEWHGWGVKGELDLGGLAALAQDWQAHV